MKAYKKLSTAKKNCNGLPIIAIGNNLYIIGEENEIRAYTQIAIIHPETGCYTGNVGLKHLERLGNANWAEPGSGKSQLPDASKHSENPAFRKFFYTP